MATSRRAHQHRRHALAHARTVVSPHVEYRLTDLGTSLREAVQPLLAWRRTHLGEIEAHRADA